MPSNLPTPAGAEYGGPVLLPESSGLWQPPPDLPPFLRDAPALADILPGAVPPKSDEHAELRPPLEPPVDQPDADAPTSTASVPEPDTPERPSEIAPDQAAPTTADDRRSLAETGSGGRSEPVMTRTPEQIEPSPAQGLADHNRRGRGSDWLLPVTGIGIMMVSAYGLVLLIRNRRLES